MFWFALHCFSCCLSFFLSIIVLFLSPTQFAFCLVAVAVVVVVFQFEARSSTQTSLGFASQTSQAGPGERVFEARRDARRDARLDAQTESETETALGDSNLPLSECKSMRRKSSQQQAGRRGRRRRRRANKNSNNTITPESESINKRKAKRCAINHRKTHECRVIMRSYFNCRIIIMLRTLSTPVDAVVRLEVCKARHSSRSRTPRPEIRDRRPSPSPNPYPNTRGKTKQNTCRPPVSGHVCAWTGACTKKKKLYIHIYTASNNNKWWESKTT